MFNKKDVSTEIAAIMESNLITNAVEQREESLNKFAKALDYLNSVAEIFDELGLRKEAEATTTLLEVVAAKKSKKKKKVQKSKKKKNVDTTELTSERMVDNLEHKGWMFDADDQYSDPHHDSCMCSMCMDTNDSDDYDFLNIDDFEDESYASDHHKPILPPRFDVEEIHIEKPVDSNRWHEIEESAYEDYENWLNHHKRPTVRPGKRK